MISTKLLVGSSADVPSSWGFQYYLKLSQPLSSDGVKMHSVFRKEKTPSMYIYYNDSKSDWYYKDFSSGNGGNLLQLVQDLFRMSFSEAKLKVLRDYNDFVMSHGEFKVEQFKSGARYRVTSFEKRQWFTQDKEYWVPYGIGSNMLEKYNIQPLREYTMSKNDDVITIKHSNIYGFFRADGTLYKIYQPKLIKKKFIKVADYTQGLDQLKYDKPYLVICSSLKDAMCMLLMGFNIEVIAPDSENSIIKPSIINLMKEKYEKIITIFDNDEAGKNGILKYQQIYGIPGAVLEMEKDIADSVYVHKIKEVKQKLIPILEETLNRYKK